MKQVLIVLLCSSIALGKPSKCDDALSACQDLVTAQDESIVALKKQVSTLQDRLNDSQPSVILTPLNTFLVGIVVGVLGGVILIKR